jgi:hypothetical protein
MQANKAKSRGRGKPLSDDQRTGDESVLSSAKCAKEKSRKTLTIPANTIGILPEDCMSIIFLIKIKFSNFFVSI